MRGRIPTLTLLTSDAISPASGRPRMGSDDAQYPKVRYSIWWPRDAQRLMLVAALLSMTTVVPSRVAAATPWNPTEPETYICTTEYSAGIENARVRIGRPQGNEDDRYVGSLDLPDDFRRFKVTITPWDKVPENVKPAFRERLPDRVAGSGEIFILSLDRHPSLASLLDDAYIGRAPVPVWFRSGPPDPMEDAIKFNGYANTFIFHRDADHPFAVFVYQYGFEWVIEGHCQQDVRKRSTPND